MKRVLVLALAFGCVSNAYPQDWPRQKPIHFVVASAPGSTTDIVARLAAPKVSGAIGQAVVVENRPGAGGNVGAQKVKRSAPDGYSVLVTSVAFVVNVALYANPGYDLDDFAPVILGPSTPNLIAVNPSVPAKSLQELVMLARSHDLSYASPGVGTAAHLLMERLKTLAKVDITHVPYQPAQAVGATVAGHTQISSTPLPPATTHARAGRVRPIAVTSAQRSPVLPDVPTVNEQGFAGFDDRTWTGFFAPVATAQDIVNRLNSDLNAAFLLPDVQQRLARHRLEWRSNTAGEFAAFLRAEAPKWAQAVRDAGAKAD
ncbi:MAG TPA: tripartite tricarboxylate transporter substrate-binding protein [Burkholderiales bacterium]|nr:tripartite tricarboxylate transporter substrate-binding protein [Burkholderiales bacterium]